MSEIRENTKDLQILAADNFDLTRKSKILKKSDLPFRISGEFTSRLKDLVNGFLRNVVGTALNADMQQLYSASLQL